MFAILLIRKSVCIKKVHPKSDRNFKREKMELQMMYAIGPGNGIYHLVVRNDSETLCGLKVSRLRSEQSLHLVTDVSEGSICKHCERINRNGKLETGK